jgi:hypothetical protein
MRTLIFTSLAVALGASAAALPAGAFSAADTVAIYVAAGYPTKGGKLVGCNAGNPDWPASDFNIEPAELNGAAGQEAFVNEGSTACYGNTGNQFTVVAKNAAGKWVNLGAATGIPVVLTTKHGGWYDIKIGGPGFGKMPVMRWNGKAYAY